MPRFIWGLLGAVVVFSIVSLFRGLNTDYTVMSAVFSGVLGIWIALLSIFLGSDVFLRNYEEPVDPLIEEFDRRPENSTEPEVLHKVVAETITELLARQDISVARPEAFQAFLGMFGTDVQRREFAKLAEPYIQAGRSADDPVIHQASLCIWNCMPDLRRLYANREPIAYPLYQAALTIHCSEYPVGDRASTIEGLSAEIDPKCDMLAEKYFVEFSNPARKNKNATVPGQRLWAYILSDHRRSDEELDYLFCPYTSDLYCTGKLSKNLGRTPKQIFLIILIVLAYLTFIALAVMM